MVKVMVLGSINVDTILQLSRVAVPGETLAVNEKSNAAGGKGANQAVAAARAGADTAFIGKVGKDDLGNKMLKTLQKNNIDTTHIAEDKKHGTGSATILVYGDGQNNILVYGGANQEVTLTEVKAAKSQIAASDFLITQFETPQEDAVLAFQIAKENHVTTILNPAPASEISPDLLKVTDLIIPNETESATLTGIEVTDEASMDANAAKFREMGVKNLIITIGDKGAYYNTESAGHGFVPAYKVHAVDPTAAGDTFIGALSSQLKPDLSNVKEALMFAQRASSLTVQKLGAMPSIPTLAEINAAQEKDEEK
ncbi:ribokinase [Levilactobacillus bambusae]|uniref:Ribokinase n=1 Tax=Levilactobacillus bambusae TaxID=2024736 RepID=A0A2V1N2E4_9LACO|nr:ribokinase [Levilactobacillus bambusae]PWG00350.1 ribokinase [Levilactobacillus bambusae]